MGTLTKSFSAWVVLPGLTSGYAVGSQDAVDWLMKINNTARTLSCSGVLVYVDGNRIETIRVIQRDDAGGTIRQRIYALNGVPSEIVTPSEFVSMHPTREPASLNRNGRRDGDF